MPDAATWTAIIAPITTMLSGLGGYWLAGRNEETRDRRAAAREAASRRAALAERMEEQRHTIQRDTLLELQDELQRLMRITARINLQDRKTLKERRELYQLPEGLSDEAHQTTISVHRLRSRLLDPELREAVGDFVAECSRDAMSTAQYRGKPPEESITQLDQQLMETGQKYMALSEQLGEQLRRELDRRFLATEPLQGGPYRSEMRD